MKEIQNCNRIQIIGASGSGKSYIAAELGEIFGLPVIHMDLHFWRPDWEKTDAEVFTKHMCELMEQQKWIMEGAFSNLPELMAARLEKSDLVIFLNVSERECLENIKSRVGKKRPDWPEYLPEDGKDLKDLTIHVKDFFQNHPERLSLFSDKHAKDKVVELSSRAQVADFINKCQANLRSKK